MDLFSITCTTCKSRLKVREESAIGQILACPKCGGMVMVRPPDNWQAGVSQPTSAEAPQQPPGITTVVEMRRPEETLGDSQFDAIEELFGDAPPKARPSSVSVAPDAPGLARPRFVNGPPAAGSHAAPAQPANIPPSARVPAGASGTAAPNPASGPTLAGSATHSPPDTTAAQQSPATDAATIASRPVSNPPQESPPPPGESDPPPDASELVAAPATSSIRYCLMMAGSVAAGIALALAVVLGMIWLFKADPQQVVQANSGPTAPTVTNTGDVPDATPDSLAPVPAVNPAPADPADLETPVASPTKEPQPAAVAVPPKPADNPDDPPVAPEGDPLGLTKPIPTPAAPVNPKDPLAKFDALIGGDAEDPLAKPDETPEPPPTTAVDPGPEEETPAKPMLPRPPPREIDTVARLADPIPGIETSGTPLADFLRVISDLSTVPIVLETAGLPLVRVTPESPVVLKVSDTTVGGALTAALAPLGLEHVVADGHLLVRVIEPAEMPTLSFPAKDLSAGDELQMTELAEALKTLVAPNAWNEADGSQITVNAAKGTLDIRQRRAVHASLLVAFEKLRTARKLPYATGTKYDSTMFALQSRSSKAKAKLDLPVSMTFAQPTNFVKILNHLEQAAGARILVDWRDIAAAGWNADGEATLVVEKQPLAAALDALLVPMDLSWRVIDGRTLEIVTNSRLAEELELEFYNVAALTAEDPSGAALVARIRGALGESLFLDAGGQCELRSDEPGQCVLASLPQPKQRELEALLERWRTESAAE